MNLKISHNEGFMGSDDNVDVDALEELLSVIKKVKTTDDEAVSDLLYSSLDKEVASSIEDAIFNPSLSRYDKQESIIQGLKYAKTREGTDPNNAISHAIQKLSKFVGLKQK
jgi:hypothetical protein